MHSIVSLFLRRKQCKGSCARLSTLSSRSTTVSQQQLLELRNRTSMPLAQCKAALVAAQGNMEAAMAQLAATYADRFEARKETDVSRDVDAGCIALKIAENGRMASLVQVSVSLPRLSRLVQP